MRFVITGRPVTKSNHQRIMRGKAGRPFVMQSANYVAWEAAALVELRGQLRFGGPRGFADTLGLPSPSTNETVNLRALIYRDRKTGDLGNYLKAICDVLERAGIVENDRLIRGFDGSRLLIDRVNPRVELELTPLAEDVAA